MPSYDCSSNRLFGSQGACGVKYFKNNKPFRDKIILQILDYYKNLWALSYVGGIAHWDLETYMPSAGAASRGEALGRLSVIRQKMFLDPAFVNLIHQAEKSKTLSEADGGVVRVLVRSLDFYEKIPSGCLDKFENLTNTSTIIWRTAKEKNNFKLFEPS